jgi:glutaredoxin
MLTSRRALATPLKLNVYSMLFKILTASLFLISSSACFGSNFSTQDPTNVNLSVQEKPELNLFYANYCPYSRKVLNYLAQIHKKITLTDVHNNPQAKEYLRTYGGLMQVPCLFINGQPLYDADEIILWLSQHQSLL